jgi:hypothetical protein
MAYHYHTRSREKAAMAVVAFIIIAVLGYIIWLYMTGKAGAPGAGPSPSPTTTTTSAPVSTLQPKSGPPNPASLVYVPDYVTCGSSSCTYSAQGFGSLYDIIAYGGKVNTANITYGNAYVVVNGYQLYLFGIATTTPTLNFTDTSGTVYVWGNATAGYGYILYKPAQAAVLLTAYKYNVTGLLYYVYVPASADNGMPISGATYRIYVVHGTAYVNGNPVTISLGSWSSPPSGILPAWGIYASQPGTYQFTVQP